MSSNRLIAPIGSFTSLSHFQLGKPSTFLAKIGLVPAVNEKTPYLMRIIPITQLPRQKVFQLDLQSSLFHQLDSTNILRLNSLFFDQASASFVQVYDFCQLQPLNYLTPQLQQQITRICSFLDAKKLQITNLSAKSFACQGETVKIMHTAKIVFNGTRKNPNSSKLPSVFASFQKSSSSNLYKPTYVDQEQSHIKRSVEQEPLPMQKRHSFHPTTPSTYERVQFAPLSKFKVNGLATISQSKYNSNAYKGKAGGYQIFKPQLNSIGVVEQMFERPLYKRDSLSVRSDNKSSGSLFHHAKNLQRHKRLFTRQNMQRQYFGGDVKQQSTQCVAECETGCFSFM